MKEPFDIINGIPIHIKEGKKSRYDFVVQYYGPKKRMRTPKHIHLAVDLCMKKTGNPRLTKMMLMDMKTIVQRLQPSRSYPPNYQVYSLAKARKYRSLNKYGEYPVEFLLAVFELIAIQEKTNYPRGTASASFVESILSDSDIFSIVSGASWTNRKR